MMARLAVPVLLLGMAGVVGVPAQTAPPPILDMHLHAEAAASQGPPPLAICPGTPFPPGESTRAWSEVLLEAYKHPSCAAPIWSPETDRDIMDRTLAIMRRRNVYGVTSGPRLAAWRAADAARVIPSLRFNFGPSQMTPDAFRDAVAAGTYKALGEVTIQYQGAEPGDPRFEPYLALAEEIDVPVSIHVGTGPPGAPYLGFRNYRARLHSPLLIEEVLVKHPTLRISLMHAGWPMIDDLLAVMWTHPQVYVDVGVISWALPRAGFHDYLQRLVEAGFGRRVMFGSDQMVWPEALDVAIDAVESAPFLSQEQRRDIMYNNAARFLRLSEDEIARHHGR